MRAKAVVAAAVTVVAVAGGAAHAGTLPGLLGEPAIRSAPGEKPPPATAARSARAAQVAGTTAAVDATGAVTYRVDSGFDLDQYLSRGDSPLNFSIDITQTFGPVSATGAPAPGNALYGKQGLLTLRVYDVDEADGEVDHLSVNGTKLPGQLTGANDQWATDTFAVPTSLLRLPTASNPSGTNEFTVDIDVTGAGWAVQVDWAELRPLDASNGVRPAVFVHGITGNSGPNGESSMSSFKNYVVSEQPELAGRAIAPPLTKNDSIAANVAKLAPAIDGLVADEPVAQVDIVAHSMGGLNSRLYAFDNPGRVRKLVMVATPNGGSRLADIICTNEKIPWYLRGAASAAIDYFTNNFGECDSSDAGIYQLQQKYVQDVFNRQVPDLPSVDYVTIAGQGFALGNILLDGEDDGAVSVASVRYLDRNSPAHPGLHTSLQPAYETDHSGLIQPGSPAYRRALCHLYYTSLDTCRAGAGAARRAAPQQRAEAAGGTWQPAGGPVDTVPAGQTRTYRVDAAAGQAAKLIINTESSDLTAKVSTTAMQPTSLFGLSAGVAAFSGPQTLTVTNAGSAARSFFSFLLVDSDRALTVDAPAMARPGASVPFTVTLTGGLTTDQPRYEVTDESDVVIASGPLTRAAGDQWTGAVTLPKAGAYSVTAWVEGDQPRGATTPVTATAGGTVGEGMREMPVDADTDNLYDRLDVAVPVTVDAEGDHRLAGQLVAADGRVIATAGARTHLAAGTGEMVLSFDGRAVFDSQAPGPWHLKQVMLSDDQLTPIDVVTDAGEISTDDFRAYEHDLIHVSAVTDAGVDRDTDGTFEQLRITATVGVETPGTYAINGKLVAADGTEVGRTQLTTDLTTEPGPVHLDFDGAAIGATGKDGPYTLRDLAIYNVNAPAGGIALVDAYTTGSYRSSQFPGGSAPDAPPVAAFTETVSGRTVTVDAATSSDDRGIASYAWTFGDGTGTISGVTAAHTYARPGSYTVTLSVTDQAGQSASVSRTISVADATATCAGRPATIIADGRSVIRGTNRVDVIVGTSRAETIHGLGGSDIICANGGNDRIIAGNGNDVVRAGAGNDIVDGGAGLDNLSGEDGNDRMLGGRHDDTMSGGKGNDVLYGGAGRDRLDGGPGHDRVIQ